jgi:hypothetical protein
MISPRKMTFPLFPDITSKSLLHNYGVVRRVSPILTSYYGPIDEHVLIQSYATCGWSTRI